MVQHLQEEEFLIWAGVVDDWSWVCEMKLVVIVKFSVDMAIS